MDEDVEWIEHMTSMDFHPCDTPRGMMYYNMDVLTKEQQRKLNSLKIKTLRGNQKYLASHPEIRACVAIITKLVLKQRPRTNIHEPIAEYFSKSRVDIEADIQEYFRIHIPRMYGARSRLDMFGNLSDFSAHESESSSSTLYSSTCSESSLSSLKESMWKMDIPDIDVETLQMDVPGSLKNIGIEYGMIKKMGSETPMHSISIVTQSAKDEDRGIKTTSIIKPDHITINEYLKELESISYADMMEGEMYEEGPSTGHIPRLEDYDAGYGRRRQTFEADQEPLEDIDGPIAEYMAEMENIEEEKQSDATKDFPLAPRLSDDVRSHSHIRAERILKTSLDSVPRAVAKKSKSNVERDESEIKALMARRSVRISTVVEGDLKQFETKMEDDEEYTEKRRSQDEGEKRVRTSVDKGTRLSLEERSSKPKTHTEKTTDQSNRLHLDDIATKEEAKQEDAESAENVDERSLGSDHREEEVSRKSVDQKGRAGLSRVRQVSLASSEEPEEGFSRRSSKGFNAERPSISRPEGIGSIESTIKHQFDTSFKSVSQVRENNDESKSKANLYFSKTGETNDPEGSQKTNSSLADSHSLIKSKLEQKVSFGVDINSNPEGKILTKSETSE